MSDVRVRAYRLARIAKVAFAGTGWLKTADSGSQLYLLLSGRWGEFADKIMKTRPAPVGLPFYSGYAQTLVQTAPDAEPYTSYTEKEFHRAFERLKQTGKPEMFVFFKRVDPVSEANPDSQIKQVIDFRKHLEENKQVLYRYFENERSFIEEVETDLRAFAKDDLPKADEQRDIVVLPLSALERIKKSKSQTRLKEKQAHVSEIFD